MLLFALLTVVLVLCAALALSFYSSIEELDFNAIKAEKLSDKPEKYFVVTNIDPALLQAISHSGEYAFFHLLDETQIDELIGQYETNNIEYQNNYYRIYILFVEPSPINAEGFWISIFGFVASTFVLVSYAFFKVIGSIKKRKKQNRTLLRNPINKPFYRLNVLTMGSVNQEP